MIKEWFFNQLAEWCFEMGINRDLHHMSERLSQLCGSQQRIEEYLMALQPAVQALLDAVAVQGGAITDATGHLVDLEAHVADLDAKLAAVQPNVPIDAEDLAAIVAVTGTITNSVASIKGAMPQRVPPDVVVAATDALPPADVAPTP